MHNPNDPNDNKLDRRSFINQTAGVVASSAFASSALSYDRILGANDRIALGHIGIGNRGSGLHMMASSLKDKYNVETVAVCDLWKNNRERAAANSERYFGRAPRAVQHLEELLALKDVDAVMIATPEHSHSPMLKAAVEAGKDAYCEKPMGNVLEEVKAARDAVKQSARVVQIGTQHRSEPYQLAAREVLRSGVLGDVSKYEIVWNYNGPRWRGRPEVKQIREEDTDWKKWLMTKPDRPFDPQLYFEFRLYKEFSSGIPDQWMSHGIDLVHFFMNDQPPRSVVAHGGVYAWHDGRENPDTFQALVEYPSFLVELLHELRQRLRQLLPDHGKEGDAREHRRRGQPALEGGRGKGQPRRQPDHRARRAVGHASRRRQAGPDQHRRRGPVPSVELVRVPAQPEHPDERDRGQRLPALGRRHHGSAIRTGRASACTTTPSPSRSETPRRPPNNSTPGLVPGAGPSNRSSGLQVRPATTAPALTPRPTNEG